MVKLILALTLLMTGCGAAAGSMCDDHAEHYVGVNSTVVENAPEGCDAYAVSGGEAGAGGEASTK